ncbi:DUF998 domain-containing protein [Nonomuraea sp. NPDC049419]|uniref:DUF998 domain-containing protein n=1 Tax=Nonomuraea sp. NPDC049419 TaxID=3155772 RepID=UPI003418EEA9
MADEKPSARTRGFWDGRRSSGMYRSVAAGVAWLSCLQVFAVDFVVQAEWVAPYPVSEGYLSDLGNTACGPTACSPRHALMNGSFLVLGLLLVAGLLLASGARGGRAGRVMVALAGLGWILVGLAPENENMLLHLIGALLIFVCGNVGMIVYGLRLRTSGHHFVGVWSLFTGAVGVAATALFLSGQFLGLGLGGMERLAVYAIVVWAAVLGVTTVVARRPTATLR